MNNPIDLILDFTSLPDSAIALESEQFDRAIRLSEQFSNPARQWQIYVNALAIFGFEQWLAERDLDLPLNKSQCTVFKPHYGNVLENALCHLRVGDFKLCLLTRGTLIDDIVTIPRAVIDLPHYQSHFYILITVDEEQEQTVIESIIRYDQLMTFQDLGNLRPKSDWTYEVPIAWFSHDINQLLLYFRCLEPNAIPLPPQSFYTSSQLQTQLQTKIRQLSSPDCSLPQILTWEEGASLFSDPTYLDWLYRLQTPTILSRFTQSAVNVGLWLRDELDELSQSVGWRLLPELVLAGASFRSLPTLSIIIEELGERGINLPNQARGAYQDFPIGENSFRLYALTWGLPDANEWSLLLILGMQTDDLVLEGLKLQVSDSQSLLLERTVNNNEDQTYLYARVIGNLNDQFTITISLNDGQSLMLSPFIFNPEQ